MRSSSPLFIVLYFELRICEHISKQSRNCTNSGTVPAFSSLGSCGILLNDDVISEDSPS
jgi:hypothetical protein